MQGTPMVLLEGRVELGPWTETDRTHCPNGCAGRKLDDERHKQLNRLCLRCFTWTYDRGVRTPEEHERRIAGLRLLAAAEDERRTKAALQAAKERCQAKKEEARKAEAKRAARNAQKAAKVGPAKGASKPKPIPLTKVC